MDEGCLPSIFVGYSAVYLGLIDGHLATPPSWCLVVFMLLYNYGKGGGDRLEDEAEVHNPHIWAHFFLPSL